MYSLEEITESLTNDRDTMIENLTDIGVSGLTGDETFTELADVVGDIEIINLEDYLGNAVVEPPVGGRGALELIKKIPEVIITTRNASNTFSYCSNLTEVGVVDFGTSLTDIRLTGFFSRCTNLQTISFKNVRANMFYNYGLSDMFAYCPSLTDQTLENILDLCIRADYYYNNKKLTHLGFTATDYPVSRLETLSNYQAFLDAGWTTGY